MHRPSVRAEAWRFARRDPLVLAGLALILVWAVAMLPWTDLQTRADLSQLLFDPLGLVLPMLACVLAARRSTRRQEATFWWFVVAALGAWLIGVLPRFPGFPLDQPGHAALWADCWYVGYYVLLFTAAGLRPGEDAPRERIRLETAGFLVLVAATTLYAVLAPVNLDPEMYASRVSSFLLYLVLDVLLLVVFSGLARDAEVAQWRLVYRLVAGAAAGFVLFDALQGLWMAGVVPLAPYGTPIDAAWQAPVMLILIAARVRDAQRPHERIANRARPIEATDSFPARLILFASVLPVVHLFIYGIGLGDPSLQRVRIFIVLASMLVLQGLAVIESRRLVRRNLRLKREQLNAAASLQQAHYWETVGRLAGGIAHEFNNILTAILGHASMLRRRVGEDAQAAADLGVIEASGERAGELVRQMLAFGRRQAQEPEPIDAGSLLRELCSTRFPRLLGDGVELRTDLGEDIPPVHVDRQGLVDVLTEVVVNAADAMPDGGLLTITTRLEGEPAGDDAARVLIVVRDAGKGMDGAVLARAFEPFFTTKDVGQGTGLGLSSAFGTMEQMNGEIEIRSEPGHGTEVTLRLPGAEASAPSSR